MLGETRELSKVFFETVTIQPVDDTTNSMFDFWIDELVELKKQGANILHIEREIELKLFEIYKFSETEIQLIQAYQLSWSEFL